MYQKVTVEHVEEIDKDLCFSLINFDTAYYCNFDDRVDVRALLKQIKCDNLVIGIETHNFFLESLNSVIASSHYRIRKINSRVSYIEIYVKKEEAVENQALLAFLMMVAETNDFVFIAIDPYIGIDLYDMKNRKLQVNTKWANIFIVYNYDADSLIIFK
ncbi:hypothetical protein [Planococcus halotolerans]|uniref:Uncharacterized protein n=1 Tax=Planococcus halotolerans TaxID=2233542 RepID=A0A365L1R2_9BACL|nr:hypothetical protein [Planococcus halotolerans]QHJ70936.1 hypothetical protein DNR44_010075 [Planococcus halotolerans]RAZ79307.1 hypothetical protein DP120_06770 [Planococcus halotolerans]